MESQQRLENLEELTRALNEDLAQQVLVKMLEYTFEKAIAASSADMVTGDRRSVVAGNVSMLKIGLGFLLGAGFISRFSANDPRPVRPPPPTPAGARAPLLTDRSAECRRERRVQLPLPTHSHRSVEDLI